MGVRKINHDDTDDTAIAIDDWRATIEATRRSDIRLGDRGDEE